jgi:hypothetical protein
LKTSTPACRHGTRLHAGRQGHDKKGGPRNMKKNNRNVLFILLIFLLLFIITVGIGIGVATGQKGSTKNKIELPVQVKIPDGLYFYKPYFGEDRSGIFSPLVLVKNKKLVDPYVLAEKIGLQKLLDDYVIGKEFDVYVWGERYGTMRELHLRFKTYFHCRKDEFIRNNIKGEGTYEGKPLPSASRRATGILITPQSYQAPKGQVLFPLTDEDLKRMVEEVRKSIVPKEIEYLNKRRTKIKSQAIGEEGSRLDLAEALDLDGNGMKDLVGIYYLSAAHTPKGYWPRDILFVLWDTGKVEKIASESVVPAFMLGGAIDIDQDGIQELIVVTNVSSMRDDTGVGRQIDIFRHGPSGWKSIFRPKWICSEP